MSGFESAAGWTTAPPTVINACYLLGELRRISIFVLLTASVFSITLVQVEGMEQQGVNPAAHVFLSNLTQETKHESS
jgi:hypothetical protein